MTCLSLLPVGKTIPQIDIELENPGYVDEQMEEVDALDDGVGAYLSGAITREMEHMTGQDLKEVALEIWKVRKNRVK